MVLAAQPKNQPPSWPETGAHIRPEDVVKPSPFGRKLLQTTLFITAGVAAYYSFTQWRTAFKPDSSKPTLSQIVERNKLKEFQDALNEAARRYNQGLDVKPGMTLGGVKYEMQIAHHGDRVCFYDIRAVKKDITDKPPSPIKSFGCANDMPFNAFDREVKHAGGQRQLDDPHFEGIHGLGIPQEAHPLPAQGPKSAAAPLPLTP